MKKWEDKKERENDSKTEKEIKKIRKNHRRRKEKQEERNVKINVGERNKEHIRNRNYFQWNWKIKESIVKKK